MKTHTTISSLIAFLQTNDASGIVLLVEATGNGGRTAEVCRKMGLEPVLLTAGKELKYSRSVQTLSPEVCAFVCSAIYDNNGAILQRCIQEIDGRFQIAAILTPNEAPAKLVASLDLPPYIRRTLPAPHYSSKITQRTILSQQIPRWSIVNADDHDELKQSYHLHKDNRGRVMFKQHLGVGKRGIYICSSEEEVVERARCRERTNNYGVPVDDGRMIIEEFVPHNIEISCDIATFGGIQYLVGSPVSKKSGGVSGIIESKHIVGSWSHYSPIDVKKIVDAIDRAKLASALMSKSHNRIDHVELMLDERSEEWVVTEVNFGRPGGDSLPIVQRLVVGVDPIEIGVRVLLGRIDYSQLKQIDTQSIASISKPKIGISAYFIAENSGTVSYNREAYERYQGMNTNYLDLSIDLSNGDQVHQTMTRYDRCGHYIIHADDFPTLIECEGTMLRDIGFAIH